MFFETRFPDIFLFKYNNTCCVKNDKVITKSLFTPFTLHLFCKKTQNVVVVIIVLRATIRKILAPYNYSNIMCAGIKNYVKILFLEFLNENHIFYIFCFLCKEFLTNCM